MLHLISPIAQPGQFETWRPRRDGAWRCAAPQGLGSECSVFRVWVQRFTSVTRVLQRSVMCVSKALTPHEEHGGSTYGDRGNSERSQKAAESATRTERSKRQGEAASDRAERPGADGAAKQNGKHQAPNGKRQATIDRTGRLAANGRRRAARNAT